MWMVNKMAKEKFAFMKERNLTLKGYSDGSLVHETGAYGWVVGFVTPRGEFSEIARGWGIEREKDNPTRSISTGRMEALGLLRMLEFLQSPSWKGPATLQLDNETVAKRACRDKEPSTAYWTLVDYDIWQIIDQISSPNGRWSGLDPTRRTRRSCQQTRRRRNSS